MKYLALILIAVILLYIPVSFAKAPNLYEEDFPDSNPSSSPEELMGAKIPDTQLTGELISADKDRAGVWGNFGPGTGNVNNGKYDWEWRIIVKPFEAKDIGSIEVYHNKGPLREAWSTSNPNFYPLVVYNEGIVQFNRPYTEFFGVVITPSQYMGGNYMFTLYGQIETPRFFGGTVIIKFRDGTSISAQLPASDILPPNAPMNKMAVKKGKPYPSKRI